MERGEATALPTTDHGSNDPLMYEYNDIGLALRLSALRKPDFAWADRSLGP